MDYEFKDGICVEVPKKTAFIIRGLPGSGKSTYAKSIGCFHIEADMFHVVCGKYEFNEHMKRQAHELCFDFFTRGLMTGCDVAVSNTFTQLWEFEKYIEYATAKGYVVKVIHLKASYGSVHNVPFQTRLLMESRWEKYKGEEIVEAK